MGFTFYIYKVSYPNTMTKTSAFLVFLVKTCFISIVKTEQKIRFSWIKLFVYMACSLGFFLANIIPYYKVKAIKDAQIEQQLSVKVNIYKMTTK